MRGVTFDKTHNKWYVHFIYFGRRIRYGYHDTEEQAAIAYNEAQIQFFGNDARLNYVKTKPNE